VRVSSQGIGLVFGGLLATKTPCTQAMLEMRTLWEIQVFVHVGYFLTVGCCCFLFLDSFDYASSYFHVMVAGGVVAGGCQ
jgi:hypothetical protein